MLALAETSAVFFKETTDRRHHAVLADQRFLTEVTHTFLIREPAEIAASCYALQGSRLKLPELGLEYAYDLYQANLAAGGAEPVVVDSADLISDPAATMAAYCAATRHSIPPVGPALVTRRAGRVAAKLPLEHWGKSEQRVHADRHQL